MGGWCGAVDSRTRFQDGELIEIEQWGGWTAADCPPICGLWGNVWKGTGLLMRVTRPFASLSKITAIVEMALELGRRDDSVLSQLVTAMKIDADVALVHAKYPESSLAECFAYCLLTMQHPCEGADPRGQLRPLVMLWMRRGARFVRPAACRLRPALLRWGSHPLRTTRVHALVSARPRAISR